MNNNCDFVVGGFVKKRIIKDVNNQLLRQKIDNLYPKIGQILSISNSLNTNSDKPITDYMSLVYTGYNPFDGYSLEPTYMDDKLVEDFKVLEKDSTTTIKSLNTLSNIEEILTLKKLIQFRNNLLDNDLREVFQFNHNNDLYSYYYGALEKNGKKANLKSTIEKVEVDIKNLSDEINLNSKDVLNYILNEKEISDYYKLLGNILNSYIDSIENPSVSIVKESINENNRIAAGSYRFIDNTIDLSDIDSYYVIHEIVHAFTMGVLFKDKYDVYTNPIERLFNSNINNLYEKALAYNKKNGNVYYYGLKNIYEFVAEGLSSKSFQEFLDSIPLKEAGTVPTNVYSKLIQSIRNLINSVLKSSDRTVLSELVNEVMTYIDNDNFVTLDKFKLAHNITKLSNTINSIESNIDKGYTIDYKDYKFIATDNDNNITVIDSDTNLWSMLLDLYEDNNENLYSTILEDALVLLKNERSVLKDEYNTTKDKVADNTAEQSLSNILERIKITDNDYYKSIVNSVLNTYQYSEVEEVAELNLTINPEEGTKISHCQ